jgi:hypothetical protein
VGGQEGAAQWAAAGIGAVTFGLVSSDRGGRRQAAVRLSPADAHLLLRHLKLVRVERGGLPGAPRDTPYPLSDAPSGTGRAENPNAHRGKGGVFWPFLVVIGKGERERERSLLLLLLI